MQQITQPPMNIAKKQINTTTNDSNKMQHKRLVCPAAIGLPGNPAGYVTRHSSWPPGLGVEELPDSGSAHILHACRHAQTHGYLSYKFNRQSYRWT